MFKFLKITLVFCFIIASFPFSKVAAELESVEMTTHKVIQTYDFEDFSDGGSFILDDADASKWFTYTDHKLYHSYYLELDQIIAIIPMTEKDVSYYKEKGGKSPWNYSPEWTPHWIVLNPKADQSKIGIAFKYN